MDGLKSFKTLLLHRMMLYKFATQQVIINGIKAGNKKMFQNPFE